MSRKIKINKGAVLSVLLLIGIICYLVILSFMRANDEIDIKQLCTNYVAIETQANMLPEEYRYVDTDISANELNSYIKNVKDSVKNYFIDNEKAYDHLTETLESSLIRQAGGGNILLKFNRTIISFENFEYRDGLVEIKMRSKVTYEYNSGGESITGNDIVEDTLIVQKVNEDWKLVYSNLFSPMYDDTTISSSVMY